MTARLPLPWIAATVGFGMLLQILGTAAAQTPDAASRQTAAEEARQESIAQQERIAQLVADLDHPTFQQRRGAEQALIALGRPALAAVDQAATSGSPEVRYRARRILREVQFAILEGGFARLARRGDFSPIELERGLLLVSEFIGPGCNQEEAERELDRLADEVRNRLKAAGHGTRVRAIDPQISVDALRHVLFEDAGFRGAATAYDHPDSSSLAAVLKSRQGLPILLCQVVTLVGHRLQMPMVGVGLPRRFMVKYDGTQAPAGFAKQDIILDPFAGGTILTPEQVQQTLRQLGANFEPDADLVPATGRSVLVRVLVNLRTDLAGAGMLFKARQAETFRAMLDDQIDLR